MHNNASELGVPTTKGGNRNWWGALLAFAMIVFSAASLNKFLGAAAFYSSRYGMPGMEAHLAEANRRGDIFFLVFVASLLIAAGFLAVAIRLDAIVSDGLRVAARLIVGLLLSIVGTGVTIVLLNVIGIAISNAKFW